MSDDATAVLSRALEMLQERGWTMFYRSDAKGPLNVRAALLRAASELPDDRWYAAYVKACGHLSSAVGGIMDWEFGTAKRPRTQEQVIGMLETVLGKLRSYEGSDCVRDDLGGVASRAF